jgi:hypothetical protein
MNQLQDVQTVLSEVFALLPEVEWMPAWKGVIKRGVGRHNVIDLFEFAEGFCWLGEESDALLLLFGVGGVELGIDVLGPDSTIDLPWCCAVCSFLCEVGVESWTYIG